MSAADGTESRAPRPRRTRPRARPLAPPPDAFGTTWSAAGRLAALAGHRGPTSVPLRLGATWGTQAVVLPALGLAPPPSQWAPGLLGRRLVRTGVTLGAASLSAALAHRERREARRLAQQRVGASLVLGPGAGRRTGLRRALGLALLLLSLD